jgi:predicted TIM-barrel fold metal-dependent hydrolase
MPPLVDAHAHIWGPDVPYAASAWTRLNYDFPVETWLGLLDKAGIAFGVVAAASLFGTHSDHTIAALKAHPRLRGTVIVDPDITQAELRAMRDVGVVGIRLQLFAQPLPDLTGHYRPLFDKLRDLDMHVHVNIEGGRLPDALPPIAASGVKLVSDHFGWSDARLDPGGLGMETLIRLCQQGKCWVKLSSGFRFDDPHIPIDHAARLVREVGTERLFWGSDAPFVGDEDKMTYERAVALFAEWVPDERVRAAIGETAYSFYFGQEGEGQTLANRYQAGGKSRPGI